MTARLVSLSGSPRLPSKTDTLVCSISRAIQSVTLAQWRHLSLAEIAADIMPSLTRLSLSGDGEAVLRTIEHAEIIVIGTPVYRASMTGALKHVLDLIDQDALRGRIAVLCATGGNRHHALMIEHQLRPLASFFGMLTIPTTVFAEDADFDGTAIKSQAIHDRIEMVARDVTALFGAVPMMQRRAAIAPLSTAVSA